LRGHRGTSRSQGARSNCGRRLDEKREQTRHGLRTSPDKKIDAQKQSIELAWVDRRKKFGGETKTYGIIWDGTDLGKREGGKVANEKVAQP